MHGDMRDLYHSEGIDIGASPHIIVNTVRDAHEFFAEYNVDERYEFLALDLIRRYVFQEGLPRESEPFFGAALYMVIRHAWSYPNPLTKTEFANKLLLKESSLEWYTECIAEKLGFAVLRDKNHLPFFLDPQGTITSVINSVVRNSVGEEIVRSIVKGVFKAADALTEKIVDQLINVVKILPSAFEQELFNLVQRKIEEESEKLLSEIHGKSP